MLAQFETSHGAAFGPSRASSWDRLVLATYDGTTDASEWVRIVEANFKARGVWTPNENQLLFVCTILRGRALTWFSAKQRRTEKEGIHCFGSWYEFVNGLKSEFEFDRQFLLDQFNALRQLASVPEYAQAHRALVN
jgi:hypothetical protein